MSYVIYLDKALSQNDGDHEKDQSGQENDVDFQS